MTTFVGFPIPDKKHQRAVYDSSPRFGPAPFGSVPSVPFGLAPFGSVRFELVRFFLCSVLFGSNRVESVLSVLFSSALVGFGTRFRGDDPNRTEFEMFFRKKTPNRTVGILIACVIPNRTDR